MDAPSGFHQRRYPARIVGQATAAPDGLAACAWKAKGRAGGGAVPIAIASSYANSSADYRSVSTPSLGHLAPSCSTSSCCPISSAPTIGATLGQERDSVPGAGHLANAKFIRCCMSRRNHRPHCAFCIRTSREVCKVEPPLPVGMPLLDRVVGP